MAITGAVATLGIGDVPDGAPVACRFGRHVGQENGGLLVFTCERCGGDFWRTKRFHRALQRAGALAANRRYAEASAVVDDALQELAPNLGPSKRSSRRTRQPDAARPAHRLVRQGRGRPWPTRPRS
jgi:hypothetical protein